MKVFWRVCAMCLWLTITSPIYWGLMAVCAYGVWRWHVPQRAWFWVFAAAAAVSLANALLAEANGALYDRARCARTERIVLGAATTAIATCALGATLLTRLF